MQVDIPWDRDVAPKRLQPAANADYSSPVKPLLNVLSPDRGLSLASPSCSPPRRRQGDVSREAPVRPPLQERLMRRLEVAHQRLEINNLSRIHLSDTISHEDEAMSPSRPSALRASSPSHFMRSPRDRLGSRSPSPSAFLRSPSPNIHKSIGVAQTRLQGLMGRIQAGKRKKRELEEKMSREGTLSVEDWEQLKTATLLEAEEEHLKEEIRNASTLTQAPPQPAPSLPPPPPPIPPKPQSASPREASHHGSEQSEGDARVRIAVLEHTLAARNEAVENLERELASVLAAHQIELRNVRAQLSQAVGQHVRYRLNVGSFSDWNLRAAPSLTAPVVGKRQDGAVEAIQNKCGDWLQLATGEWVLQKHGDGGWDEISSAQSALSLEQQAKDAALLGEMKEALQRAQSELRCMRESQAGEAARKLEAEQRVRDADARAAAAEDEARALRIAMEEERTRNAVRLAEETSALKNQLRCLETEIHSKDESIRMLSQKVRLAEYGNEAKDRADSLLKEWRMDSKHSEATRSSALGVVHSSRVSPPPSAIRSSMSPVRKLSPSPSTAHPALEPARHGAASPPPVRNNSPLRVSARDPERLLRQQKLFGDLEAAKDSSVGWWLSEKSETRRTIASPARLTQCTMSPARLPRRPAWPA